MCGIAGIAGWNAQPSELAARLAAMNDAQSHRGPDAAGHWVDPSGSLGLAHRRLSILDLSEAGRQPMFSHDGRFAIAFNGEVYNYLELAAELSDYPFRTKTDTEVILAAWQRWGEHALDRFVGMFSILIWDTQTRTLIAARDRFGVKPLHYATLPGGGLALASEIRAIHAAGLPRERDLTAWATYLAHGLHDHSSRTFWHGVSSLPGGHLLRWQDGALSIRRWYHLPDRLPEGWDTRPESEVMADYRARMEESVRFRFRSDVPVGINLSGGLDSATLLGLVHAVQGPDSDVKAFTFTTGDERYDELPWVRQMLERTHHPLIECRLTSAEVPELMSSVSRHQDGPFGGLPTLAYARLFETARREGVIVLLDGQGMDEQWAGYDYYLDASMGKAAALVQGTKDRAVRPECLTPDFARLAEPFEPAPAFADNLRNVQFRDSFITKIPRALRFNDRISMRSSTELREPFLDHQLFEIAFRQSAERKIREGTRKYLLRRISASLLPQGVVTAPKRPLQTPQREWLRGPLRGWVEQHLSQLPHTGWFQPHLVQTEWNRFLAGESDNSAYVWQWLSTISV